MSIQPIISAIHELFEDINPTQWRQLERYASFLHEKNQVMNLTAIDDLEGIYEKHFYDSLLMLSTLDDFETLCDLGTGAGFPGVVVAILYPHRKITLVEPLKKRCIFLQELLEKLELENVQIINRRGEDLKEYREYFDIVVARAVSSLNILIELGLPLVKVGGYLVAMKAAQALEEIKLANAALHQCGGRLLEPNPQYLLDKSIRYNLKIEKIKKTPTQYPRRYSQIKSKPL